MPKRFISIWFTHLRTDWFSRRQAGLVKIPFVLSTPSHGKMIVTAANILAEKEGIITGMSAADARAIVPALQVLNDRQDLSVKLLNGIAEWCIRFTPSVAVDLPDGLILDISGCAHLWGGEKKYLAEIIKRLKGFDYNIKAAIADTIGTAWAIARFGQETVIVDSGCHLTAICSLPAIALRIEAETAERLNKLGLTQVKDFIHMPRAALRRRFGLQLLQRIDQAAGQEEEAITNILPVEPYQERLPCMEPIATATGIEIALQQLLSTVCNRLLQEQKGLRVAIFKCYRIDGKTEKIDIGTNRPSCNAKHLFKLFENKIDTIEPGLGIELFILDALNVEELSPVQEKIWEITGGLDSIPLSELLDRIAGKVGANCIHRYVPDEHYWPERSYKLAASLNEKVTTAWKTDRPRPIQLLPKPERIEVTAPIPDYPPMLFRYKGKLHKIIKADGPERIEQEWWLQEGQHRDYYCVEDEEGHRYWLFRSGHYEETYQWFIHGFFA